MNFCGDSYRELVMRWILPRLQICGSNFQPAASMEMTLEGNAKGRISRGLATYKLGLPRLVSPGDLAEGA